MWNESKHHSVFINKFSVPWFGALLLLQVSSAQALTADDVLNKMDSKQQASFISGLVGGLAYARFLKDKPEQSGMDCIYNWFYGSGDRKWSEIVQWFSRHPDKPVEPLLYILIKKECGA